MRRVCAACACNCRYLYVQLFSVSRFVPSPALHRGFELSQLFAAQTRRFTKRAHFCYPATSQLLKYWTMSLAFRLASFPVEVQSCHRFRYVRLLGSRLLLVVSRPATILAVVLLRRRDALLLLLLSSLHSVAAAYACATSLYICVRLCVLVRALPLSHVCTCCLVRIDS